MIKAANKFKASIIPVDSEHNALFQILMTSNNNLKLGTKSFYDKNIKEVQLTASGGPFLDFTQKDLVKVSIKQAINHPTWKMGKKISIDSATMMNKGFEIIEACILFGLKPDQVKVVIHRQSLMHAMVVFNDESVMAHLSNHDMRIAISYALSWPSRNRLNLKSLDLTNYKNLTFEKVKKGQFKCLDLAYKAMYIGLNAPTILNAANEIAVKNFLENKIKFTDIPVIINKALSKINITKNKSINDVLVNDQITRDFTEDFIKSNKKWK